MQAFVEYGMRHASLGKEFSQWLQQVVAADKK
jgi:UTP--glucose-1-phosphate uridylyltransferase